MERPSEETRKEAELMAKELYTLCNIDAFEWLVYQKAKSIHGVVTDPPFGILEYSAVQLKKRENGTGGIWRIPRCMDGQRRSPSPRFTVLRPEDHERVKNFHRELAPLLFNVLVPGGHVLIASQNL